MIDAVDTYPYPLNPIYVDFINLLKDKVKVARIKMNKRSHFLQKFLLQLLQKIRWRESWQGRQAGLTVIEILVAAIIAVIMVTLLLGFMNQLLRTNRREQVMTETQQDMQTALSFIADDLRSAVHVYDGNCLDGNAPNCSGIFNPNNNFLPNTPNNAVPILAFWTLEPLPNALNANCTGGPNPIGNDIQDSQGNPVNIPCGSSKTPTLIVYFLRNANPNNIWEGSARIIRYELPNYNNVGAPVNGYIDPGDPRTGYRQWPFPPGGTNPISPAAATGNGQANFEILTDFVDDRLLNNINNRNNNITCPANYQITPSEATLANYGFGTNDGNDANDMRNFYACVSTGAVAQGNINRRSILFLQGNASGKAGIASPQDGFLPTLRTEVLSQGVRNRNPR